MCYDFETISGGTATEGTDYLKIPKATYWMQIGKRVDKPFVRIIDDSVPDDGETVKVKISNAHLCDDASMTLSITRAEATGTIRNTDPLPQAPMARFGRTAAVHVVEHIEERMVDCSHRGLQEHSCGSFDITGVEYSATPLSVADAYVEGALLTLVYDAALDGGSVPSGGDFVVLAGPPGRASAVPVTAVSVGGAAVALTLAHPVLPGETVLLSYLVASMHPVQDASGVRAAPLPDMAVRNETPPSTDAVDVVVSPSEIDVPAAHRPAVDLSPWLADGGASAPLGRLDLSSRAVADVSALAGLTELRVLNLGDNAVADLAPLSGLTGLRVLDLSSNAVADVGPLAGLTGLERLDLSGNRIADVSALSGLTRLEVLLLDGNGVADVLPLWSLQGWCTWGCRTTGLTRSGCWRNCGRSSGSISAATAYRTCLPWGICRSLCGCGCPATRSRTRPRWAD